MVTSPRIDSDLEYAPARQAQIDQIQDLLKLQRAAQEISSILDLDQLVDRIVNDVAVVFGCNEATLYLHDEEKSDLVLAGVRGCTLHGKGHRLKVGKQGMVGHVAASGKMRYAPDVRLDPFYISCEEHTLSEVAIPLYLGERLVGVFAASHPDLDAFPEEQRLMLQALCSHIAVAVHNARTFLKERQLKEQMDREAQEARVIQQALLPKSSPYIPGFAVTGLSVPAGAVGGDWFDLIPLSNGRWALVLADVSGKGMGAALLMSATRGMVRSLAEASCCPSEVLGRLNKLLVQDFPSGKFVTMVYAILDPARRTLSFSSAGHLPPLLVSGGEAHYLYTQTGLPLGLGTGTFSETHVNLPENSRLVFYSDGISEAENSDDEEYGRERLRQFVLNSDSMIDGILTDVRAFVDGEGLRDDATVIMVKA
jgi:sigma-B regulation protein RsbU (phosphoserine phosphatase)